MKNIIIYSKENPIPPNVFSQMFEILEYSFPMSERQNRGGHLSEFKNPYFRSMILSDGSVRGFMNYWNFSEFVYLEHFAVAKELRGHGLGAELVNTLRSLNESIPIILEAEPPEQSEIAERRVRFYERLGFVLNEYNYIQPPYKDGDPPLPLVIMSAGKKLTPGEYFKIRNVIYRNVYKLPEESEFYSMK